MDHDPIQPEPEVPPSLAEAIRRAEHRAAGRVDLSALDRAVLGSASRRIRARRGRSAVVWRIGGAVAAAAGVALAVYIARPSPRGTAVPATDASLVFDASGRVTILDAFRLARLLGPGDGRGGSPLSPTWDVTGDGTIDQRDVDAIAARAVRLDRASSVKGGAT